MKKQSPTIHVVYVPVCRVNFHMETANQYFNDSVAFLKTLPVPVSMPDKLLSEPSEVAEFIDKRRRVDGDIDLVILQCTTFTDNRFVLELLDRTSCPLFVWGVAEPVIDGSRLKLNSLTGFLGLSNAIRHYGRKFDVAYGTPADPDVAAALQLQLQAVGLIKVLKHARLGVIGTLPPGFTLSDVDVLALQRDVGPRMVTTELHQILNAGLAMPEERVQAALKEVAAAVPGFNLSEKDARAFGGFHAAVKDFVEKEQIDMLAARCWPDVFEVLAIAPCASYSVLTETLPVACEVDMNGAISMFILTQLAQSPCYFGDPAALDKAADTVAFWHCGHGAPSLANPKEAPRMGVQPNRLMGPAIDSIGKPGRVTVMRLGNAPEGGFRMIAARGEALDSPRLFQGTSLNLRMDCGSANFVTGAARDGWEYHFAVVYDDVVDALALAAEYMGLPITIL